MVMQQLILVTSELFLSLSKTRTVWKETLLGLIQACHGELFTKDTVNQTIVFESLLNFCHFFLHEVNFYALINTVSFIASVCVWFICIINTCLQAFLHQGRFFLNCFIIDIFNKISNRMPFSKYLVNATQNLILVFLRVLSSIILIKFQIMWLISKYLANEMQNLIFIFLRILSPIFLTKFQLVYWFFIL